MIVWDYELIGQIAGVIEMIAFIPYIVSILRGRTRPSRTSWWVWTAIGFVVLISYKAAGGDEAIWVPVIFFLGPLIVAIMSLWYGEGGWDHPFDRWCFLGAGVGIAAFLIFESPLIALTIGLATDFLGALPTVKKVYIDPGSENALAWTLALIANTLNLFAVDTWNYAIAGDPIYSAAIMVLITTPLIIHSFRAAARRRR